MALARRTDLLWFRLDLGRGRTSAPGANGTLQDFSVVTVVAHFVWSSTRLIEWVKGFVAGQTRLIDLEELVERVNKVCFQPSFVTG